MGFLAGVPYILLLSSPTTASITVFPSNAEPRSYKPVVAPANTNQLFFRRSCPDEYDAFPKAQVLYSGTSSTSNLSSGTVYPTSDSFVRGSIDAWGQHQHLILRPEEVWFSILAQMNFYMSNHSEALRDLFVNHTGKEEIVIEDWTWELVLGRFSTEIQKRVKTEWLLDWIMPSFTTTTDTDKMTANVLMMGLMQAYFSYTGGIICGLPSVTLAGEKKDWEKLLAKLDHLVDFGDEPVAYGKQLRPILSRFVKTFEEPDSRATREFWNNIVHAESQHLCGAPPYVLSGWLMGFFYWDVTGKVLPQRDFGALKLDGVSYVKRGIDALPVGYAQAPFIMLDYPDKGTPRFEAYVLAGNIAKQATKGVPEGYKEALQRFNGSSVDATLPHGTLKPLSGWMIYGPAPHNITVKHVEKYEEMNWMRTSLDTSYTAQCNSSVF
ncbi:hypothetical protein BCR34DRAFT_597590 [Clohesyomyces aquaticus]|uniref:DUF4419 domain-containing protein n=1 Tax=Clohesyomyces aquaticus TaxID=1231657 RepID=A0A1Y2A224_9PLEO|nr:hypothetical protein BCR34DRAFT_597590 [Clohesyomyces aquaticus]